MNIKSYSGILFSVMLLVSACNNSVQSDQAEVGEAQEVGAISAGAAQLALDTAQSEVRWVGSKVTGNHPGTINISDGSLALDNGQIVGGRFVMDMNTLEAKDESMDAENNAKLTGHLKAPDFFEVEKYPEATFEITRVESLDGTANATASTDVDTDYTEYRDYSAFKINDPTHRVTGNLTMKGTTKSITFPAKVTMTDNEVRAKANFNINRTDWNLSYGAEKSLGDKMIYSDVNLGFDVVAIQ